MEIAYWIFVHIAPKAPPTSNEQLLFWLVRRANPLPYKDVYTILDGVRGQGHYVGTYMAWQVNNNGWRTGGRYLPNRDDMASTAYWYQAEPHAPFPALPDRDGLEII